jgi:beta-lactamase regulating signal transducer with metallopeptidase domain
MTAALAAITAAGIVLPHALRLQRISPVTAVVLWLSSLALRAIVCLLAVIYLLFFLPRTGLFVALTHWCAHAPLPVSRSELAVEGHGVAALSLYVPGIVLATSLVWLYVATVRDARAARRLVAKHAVGLGPRNSLILGGSDVVFAVAGLVRPRIVVSAGALTSLDDDELAAGLDHEAGHIARRHRFVMLLAVGLRALGRAVPGSGRGVRELAFHLERDADRWALRQKNDRVALASVICKAATAERTHPPALVGLGDTDVRERLSQVLDRRSGTTRRAGAAFNALASAMVVCTGLLGAIVPAAAVSGAGADVHHGHHRHHCQHGAAGPIAASAPVADQPHGGRGRSRPTSPATSSPR